VGARSAAAPTADRKAPGADARANALRAVSETGSIAPRRAARLQRSRCERLSGKERLVLAELARGNSTDEIGVALHVSPHTVRTHVKNLMRKLGARTRAHAVAIALSERAIDMRQ
jgi:DNA-binding CsgD family transcriptional regulator